MAVTLNGIAQGFITDRLAELLRDLGFEHALVDAGEIRSLSDQPDGRPWRIGLRHGASPAPTLDMENQAVATSSGAGLVLSPDGMINHLFDPRTGWSPPRARGQRRGAERHGRRCDGNRLVPGRAGRPRCLARCRPMHGRLCHGGRRSVLGAGRPPCRAVNFRLTPPPTSSYSDAGRTRFRPGGRG